MRKTTKIWLIVAASLVLVGGMIFVGVMTAMKWDFRKLSTAKYETNTYEISEGFDHVSVDTVTSDVTFLLSEDETCRVVCYEETKMKHRVEVSEGKLTVHVEDTRNWYDYMGLFSFDHPMITVYLPQTEYASLSVKMDTGDVEISAEMQFDTLDILGSTGDVFCFASVTESMNIKTSTGDISVKNVTAGSMELCVSTGKVRVSDVSCTGDVSVRVSTGKAFLTDVSCENLYSKGTTGDLNLRRVVASKAFSVERDTGDVEFDRCDASEIFVKTDTGEVEGSLLTEKIFFVKTGTGDVDVPRTTTGGRCEITTDTGDIEIDIVG